MFFHALGNFNLHSPLRWSLAHSLNAASCPWQFQFIFPAPAVDHTFLECSFMPSVVSIYIPHSLNVASCPWQFQFTFPAPAVNHTFLECSFMPSVVSIYIPHSGGQSHIP